MFDFNSINKSKTGRRSLYLLALEISKVTPVLRTVYSSGAEHVRLAFFRRETPVFIYERALQIYNINISLYFVGYIACDLYMYVYLIKVCRCLISEYSTKLSS